MGLGQERGNGHKEAEPKVQMGDPPRANEILNRTQREPLESD
jgi:hypothetical protein